MKNFTSTLLCVMYLILSNHLFAQPTYTAKNQVTPYNEPFLFGSNFGYNPPWQDEDLANIAAGNPSIGIDGAGVKTSRPTLPGWFMEEYGYEFRLNTYQHYDNVGLKENVCIVGFPSPDQRETDEPCAGIQSEMFDNLYTPIWDNGANGTPYNDDNYYAAYLYKTVTLYKDHIRFWEIWNEPGFDYSGNCGWREPGDPVCNWWDNDPDPCINKLRAPVQHYVRMLRISWDIIKTVDPDAYVVVAGVGFESFLDAIMRNTDNPVDGSITPDYPHRGGAYFDVMGFHSYPHFDGTQKYWDNSVGGFVYERHSDKGAFGVKRRQNRYQAILDNYGYDGVTYPKKEWIITEINGPRKQFQDYVGSPEYQRNFIVKAAVVCMRNDIRAMHIYNLAERKVFSAATGEFDLFGLYEVIRGSQPYNQVKTDEGITYKTMSDLIAGSVYDVNRTAQMNMPSNIDGGAFLDPDGNYTYILWAKTTQDMSEVANASYAFPSNMNITYLESRNWEYSSSFASTQVDPTNIQLTAEPVFLTESIFSTDISNGCEPLTVNFQEQYPGTASNYSWTFEGGIPATSTSPSPSIAFQDAGTFEYSLEVTDANGNILANQTSYIVVNAVPSADFTYTLSGPIIVFENTSSANAENYNWVFGDGNTSTDVSPSHVYANNGTYSVTLIATNGCGSSTQTVTINVNTSSNFQLPFNANDIITPYDGTFRPGTNFGYNPPWTDFSLADIAAGNANLGIKGVGIKAARPTVPGWFVDEFGYEFNLPIYEHYDNLGIEENVCIIGFPGPSERDAAFYCNGLQSEMFANMYSDVWDGGLNGTPYNDDNYLAAYLYKVVELYGDDIRFWEIWNEPGFDYTGNCGWRQPGDPVCNWWDQNPDPCDYKLRAPVMHYIRLLRISYEIIKTLQPEDYVVVAGVGFPSFLDAIMRNTDNPVDGSPTADYPYGAGAYFDVMGFHSYPHIDGTMRYWDTSVGGFVYSRHSDQAIKSITNRQSEYQNILNGYGYDGNTYPKKEWIITESNIPRRQFQDYIGSEEAQVNFIMKAVVTCYKQNIHQFHVYNLGERQKYAAATQDFDVMGIYEKLIDSPEYSHVVNDEGIAYKTASDLLYGREYDEAKTNALNLPSNIDGAALVDDAGNYIYVLWAVTTIDQSEAANATYSFPSSFNLSQLYKREWDFSETNSTQTIGPNGIALTSRPIYLMESENIVVQPTAIFFPDKTVGCGPLTVNFMDMSVSNITSWNWTFIGPNGYTNSSTQQNPTITFPTQGEYEVTLVATNSVGSSTTTQTISVDGPLSVDWDYVVNGNVLTLSNSSINATHYSWDFGNGIGYSDVQNPTYTYPVDGIYLVGLNAANSCDTIYVSQFIEVGTGAGAPPVVDFSTNLSGGCGPLSIQYTNLSFGGTSYQWSFPGGTPSSSTDPNPTVVYNTPGLYSATLEATNSAGTSTVTQSDIITVQGLGTPSFTYDISNSPTISFINNSVNGLSYFWDFGDGNFSLQETPVHTYAAGGVYDVQLTVANACGSATTTQILNIDGSNLPPVAGFSSNHINGCIPMTIEFMDNSIVADSWNWTFPGGTPASSTEQNPSVIYDQVGSYDVTLEVTNANGTDVITQSNFITILDVPTADYTYTVQDSLVTFTNTSSGAISYFWTFGDGNFTTDANPTHIYSASGTYEVTLQAANGCGSTTSTFMVEVVTTNGAAPIVAFIGGTTSGCAPFTVNFEDLSSNATSWNWSFPGGTPSFSNEQNPTVTFDNVGSYSVTLEASNSFGSNVATQANYINVASVPSTVGFTTTQNGLTTTFNNSSVNANSYSWDFGDGNTSTATNPSHTYGVDGVYTVTLVATNNCGSVTTTETISVFSLPVVSFTSNVSTGCAPFAVEFTDQSSANVTSWSWSFPGGSPTSSTEQNPVIIYGTSGTYNVTLIGTNPAGSSTITQSAYIIVDDTPSTSFGSSVSSLTATFNNTSTNATSYVWDFGDGSTSNQANPVYTYGANGSYLVTLTATNACGSTTINDSINVQYVGAAPSAAFTANVTTGCAPFSVNFSDMSSGDATAWSWSFPGGTPASSTEQNPTVSYSSAGIYDVILIVSNPAGSNTASQTSMIIVGDEPVAGFTSNINGDVISLTNTSSGAISYSWDFGDGNTSTDANPTHTYTADGMYIVSMTATNDCGSVTTTETINIITAPTVIFTADVLSGCAPLTVNFSDQSTGTVNSWLWEIPGATPNTSTVKNPTFTFDTPGVYDVTLTVTNGAGSYPLTQSQMIIVGTTPTIGFNVNQSGNVYSFTNNTTGASSYLWDFGDTNTSTDMNPTHTYAIDGTYTVTLTATNACGSVTSTQTVEYVSAPTVAFSADVNLGCAPMTVQFSDQTIGTVDSWAWEFSGGIPSTSTDQNPTVTYDTPGTYDVTLTVTNSTGSYPVSQTSMIVVSDVPTAAFDVMLNGVAYDFTNNSTNGSSYLWDFGDGSMTSTDPNPSHAYTTNGTYTIQLITTNACGSDTTTQTIMAEAAPEAAFTSDEIFGCVPLTVQFTDQSANATAWNWTFDGGTPGNSTDQNPSVTYDTPGTYAVSLSVSNNAGTDNITVNSYMVVDDVPTAEFFFNSDTTHVDFLNSSVGGTNATYAWDFGDGNTSSEVEPSHDYAAGGTYLVTLTVTNDCGTATSENTVVLTTSTGEVSFLNEFSLFPNPNDGQFTIVLKGEPKSELQLNMLNVIGQYVHQEIVDFSSGQMIKVMNFNYLPVGTYIVELKSETEVIYKKVVID